MFHKKGRKGKRSSGRAGARPSAGRGSESIGPGFRFGRYVIRESIGQGGMGTIYLADDPVIGREVAVKVITMRPDMAVGQERQYRERFLREAQAAGSLVHPNIVAVHDIGQDPTVGCPYIVMEYVPGWDLRKVIESRAPLPPRTVFKIGLRIAAALDYAHGHGIVHRDVKPANVLIGERAEVKITDFGVARLPGSDLTRTDQFVGSPAYMAPEQLAGGKIDGRADLFALGVILYQLLTGRLPFDGENLSELMFRIASEPAPPPSRVLKGLSPVFDPILERALAKDPAHRFQSGEEMMKDLLALDLKVESKRKQPSAAPPTAGIAVEAGVGSARRHASGPWDLHSSGRLGGLTLILAVLFVLMTGGVRLLSRGTLLGPEAGAGDASGNRLPGTSGRRNVDRPERVVAAERVAQTAFDRLMQTSPPLGTTDHDRSEVASGMAVDSSSPMQVAGLEIRLGDTVAAERVMVRIDDAAAGELLGPRTRSSPGEEVRRLSMPPGRHMIEVTLLDADGVTEARSSIEGTLTRSGDAVLRIDRLPGSGDMLDLRWISPDASAGVIAGDR